MTWVKSTLSIMWFSFISIILVLLLGINEVNGQDRKPSRVSTYDASNLKCQIGVERSNAEEDIASIDFEYWYAIGSTTKIIDTMKMFKLEQLLYTNTEDDMVWCWEDINNNNNDGPVVASLEEGNDSNRKRNLITKQKVLRKRLSSSFSRKLGIITFTPGNEDKISKCK